MAGGAGDVEHKLPPVGARDAAPAVPGLLDFPIYGAGVMGVQIPSDGLVLGGEPGFIENAIPADQVVYAADYQPRRHGDPFFLLLQWASSPVV